MKPRDLLLLRLREHVIAPFEARGFRFSASRLRFDRTIGHARQHFHFSLSRWNHEGDATFWSMWGAAAPIYAKWHRDEWGEAPPNSALGGDSDWNIPEWARSATDHFHLSGTEADAAEMDEFIRNAEGPGLRFLDAISTWEGAAQRLREARGMFDRASDFYLIAGQRGMALSTLLEGIEAFEVKKRPDNFQELPRLRARLERYFPGRCVRG